MDFRVRKASVTDKKAVIDILNYYIENSFAAYPDKKVGYDFFDSMNDMARGNAFYVLESGEEKIVGFGILKRFQPIDVFDRAGEIGYFIMPEYTHKGLGTWLLNIIEKTAGSLGIETILASVSSLNTASLEFHEKNGFTECARFRRIGKKHGRDFDVVWMQKDLQTLTQPGSGE